MPEDLASALARVLDAEGVDLGALGLAWARVAPAVALVPAFGLKAAPAPLRSALGLLLAASVAPALRGVVAEGPWLKAMVTQAALGLPLALGAALPIWVASMVGGVVDALRGSSEGPSLPVLEGKQGPFAALWALAASLGFLASGGPSRVALAAIDPAAPTGALHVALSLASGASVAVAIAAPMLGAAALLEVSLALVARAATPASLSSVLGLGRGAVLLVCSALFFERMASLVLALSARSPG